MKNYVLFILGVSILGLILPATVVAEIFPISQIETQTITLKQGGDQADIYYPDSGNDKFPIVAVLQGALVDKSFYSQFGTALAQHGFVVVIPNHREELVLGPPGTPPVLVLFPAQLVINDVLAQMEIENVDSKSGLFGIVDTERMGVVGHSAGGAAGLFALEGSCRQPFCFGTYQKPQALIAGAFYGTNTCFTEGKTTDSRCIDGNAPPPNILGGLIDVQTDGLPVALVQGSLDSQSTPEKGTATFDILDGPRQLITIDGANHYGISNINNPPGARPDLTSPSLNQDQAVTQIATSIGDYLSIHLGMQLSLSSNSDRLKMAPQKGEVLSGDIFSSLIFLPPNNGIRAVEFFIDGNFINYESSAPYDLKGTRRGRSRPFNTGTLSDGSHTLEAVVIFSSGGKQTISNEFETLNHDFKLYASHSSTRLGKFPLEGATLSDNACIFLMPIFPNQSISRVDFFIDGRFIKRERYAPYDIKGTLYNGKPKMFDSFVFRNGTHRVGARIQFYNRRSRYVSSVFEVSN